MKFTYDGHKYTYSDNILTDSTGLEVAKVELAKDSNYDGYNYYIDLATNEVMHSTHENEVLNHSIIETLAGQYVAFNS